VVLVQECICEDQQGHMQDRDQGQDSLLGWQSWGHDWMQSNNRLLH
jgi:hypothetical protein